MRFVDKQLLFNFYNDQSALCFVAFKFFLLPNFDVNCIVSLNTYVCFKLNKNIPKYYKYFLKPFNEFIY